MLSSSHGRNASLRLSVPAGPLPLTAARAAAGRAVSEGLTLAPAALSGRRTGRLCMVVAILGVVASVSGRNVGPRSDGSVVPPRA